MGYSDDFYEELSTGRKKWKDYTYNNIIKSFEGFHQKKK